MLYLIAKNSDTAKHLISGKFYRIQPFLHTKREMDFFDLMVGIKGTLYITVKNRRYLLTSNKFLTLFPGTVHYGTKESPAGLSYYWCHFNLNKKYLLVNDDELGQHLLRMSGGFDGECMKDFYVIPEYGEIKNSDRVKQLFSQVIDFSAQNSYSPRIADYAVSLLLMELTQMTLEHNNALVLDNSTKNRQMQEIMEWIRLYYSQGLTVREIAANFGYSPDYLSTAFRKAVGLPLLQYIHKTQISAAKQLLLTSQSQVREISREVGIKDEKYFMKLFKNHEGVSPSQFRNAYASTYLSNK